MAAWGSIIRLKGQLKVHAISGAFSKSKWGCFSRRSILWSIMPMAKRQNSIAKRITFKRFLRPESNITQLIRGASQLMNGKRCSRFSNCARYNKRRSEKYLTEKSSMLSPMLWASKSPLNSRLRCCSRLKISLIDKLLTISRILETSKSELS